jgi:PAS domain-containing protein
MVWSRNVELDEPRFAAERRGYVLGAGPVVVDTENAIRTSEERYRYTIALSPLIPWIADAHGGMIDTDVRGFDRTGLSYEDCLGSGFLKAIHASDRVVVKDAWNQRAQVTPAHRL